MGLVIKVNGNPVWSTSGKVIDVAMQSAKGQAGQIEIDDQVQVINLKVNEDKLNKR